MSTDFIKAERTMFDSYGGLRLPLDAMKTREDLCSDRALSDQGPFNHHSIDDILGYRRMQENMKGLLNSFFSVSGLRQGSIIASILFNEIGLLKKATNILVRVMIIHVLRFEPSRYTIISPKSGQ